MLKKSARLPKGEFRARGYRSRKTPFFSIKIKENVLSRPRIAIVAGSSSIKLATRRSFWKRQAKATLAGIARGGVDVLVILSGAVEKIAPLQFADELKAAYSSLTPIHQ